MPAPPYEYPDRPSFIGLYASEQGIRAIDSPVKVRILDMLARQEMAFEDLVDGSGRAKSTVSVHLKDLAESGIVGAKSDPSDGRKKIFYLNALYLAAADSSGRGWFDPDSYIPGTFNGEGDPGTMARFILSTIRLTLLSQGIMIDPVLRLAGIKAGKAMYPRVKAPGIEELIRNIARIWKENNLGTLELECLDPVTINICDCFECIDLPVMGKPACAFDSGILSSLFSSFYGNRMIAIETHCYAMGSNLCRFVVMEQDEPEIS
ncbi:MAG: ArsR family transcriptional regulator [Methanomicrobiales archaeon]|nr:ArsR family transcriptional regulator [Methanomicrobiales archaeon]